MFIEKIVTFSKSFQQGVALIDYYDVFADQNSHADHNS